jgi:hypothetical protein
MSENPDICCMHPKNPVNMPIIKAVENANRPSIMRLPFVNILNRRERVDLLYVSSWLSLLWGSILWLCFKYHTMWWKWSTSESKDKMEDDVGWAEEENGVICHISRWEKGNVYYPDKTSQKSKDAYPLQAISASTSVYQVSITNSCFVALLLAPFNSQLRFPPLNAPPLPIWPRLRGYDGLFVYVLNPVWSGGPSEGSLCTAGHH